MQSEKYFNNEAAFNSVDDWSYGYIDRQNLKLFLKKHSFSGVDDEDVLTIIRRLDLDADARLKKQEFFEALKPCEPYSKIIKRKSVEVRARRKSSTEMLSRQSS